MLPLEAGGSRGRARGRRAQSTLAFVEDARGRMVQKARVATAGVRAVSVSHWFLGLAVVVLRVSSWRAACCSETACPVSRGELSLQTNGNTDVTSTPYCVLIRGQVSGGRQVVSWRGQQAFRELGNAGFSELGSSTGQPWRTMLVSCRSKSASCHARPRGILIAASPTRLESPGTRLHRLHLKHPRSSPSRARLQGDETVSQYTVASFTPKHASHS